MLLALILSNVVQLQSWVESKCSGCELYPNLWDALFPGVAMNIFTIRTENLIIMLTNVNMQFYAVILCYYLYSPALPSNVDCIDIHCCCHRPLVHYNEDHSSKQTLE